MQRRHCTLLIALAAALSLGAGESAAPVAAGPEPIEQSDPGVEAVRPDPPAREPVPAVEAAPETPRVVYRPPRRGSPRSKVGGGVRGSKALPRPLVLAPDHLALSVRESPSLFWYIDDAIPQGLQLSVVFTLIGADAIRPLIETELPPPRQAGIYRIRLEDHGVALEPDVEYAWSISLLADPEQHSLDVVSTGYLMRVSEPEGLAGRTPTAALYAELGLWYDALESLSDAIDAAPQDPTLREERSSLLRQADLAAAVD